MNEIDVLEAFVLDNPELEALEERLSAFNLFETVGVTRSELRHSSFLSFLMSAKSNGGIGDLFLKRFLQAALRPEADRSGLRPLDVAMWDLSDATSITEDDHIDVTVVCERAHVVVIIENKIDATERGDQLARYHAAAQKRYPGYELVPIFLTPDGVAPSFDSYIPTSYAAVLEAVRDVIARRGSMIAPDVLVAARHYQALLERHVVTDSDIARLSREIYRKHQRALDIIFEHRPDSGVSAYLRALAEESQEFQLDRWNRAFMNFHPKRWAVEMLQQGGGWAETRMVLEFEFAAGRAGDLRLVLLIGPGPTELRRSLHEAAQSGDPTLFRHAEKLSPRFHRVYSSTWLAKGAVDDLEPEVLEQTLRDRWSAFLRSDLPRLDNHFRRAGFFGPL